MAWIRSQTQELHRLQGSQKKKKKKKKKEEEEEEEEAEAEEKEKRMESMEASVVAQQVKNPTLSL